MVAERFTSGKPQSMRSELQRQRNSSETLTTGKDIINRLIGMIGQARYSIDLQFYTFKADTTGKKVLAALKEAKEKNPDIQIRLLVDNSISFVHGGSYDGKNGKSTAERDETYELLNEMKEEGILDAKVTNWFPHNPLVISNIFHRDHKKLVAIDTVDIQNHPDARPMALVTSANIARYHEEQRKEVGRVYSGVNGPVPYLARDFAYSFDKAKEWEHVYSVRSVGEYFQKYGLRRDFWKDVIGSIARHPQKPGERLVYTPGPKGHDEAVLTDSFLGELPLVGKRLGAREATNELFTMLDLAAPSETVIAFSPYPGIFSVTRHLEAAAKKGVQVHLIVSSSYEHDLMNPKNPKKFLETVLSPLYANWQKRITHSGVILHDYVGENEGYSGELHAKGVVWIRSDDSVRTLIGSTNFSKGPLAGMNREIAVVEESDTSDPLVEYAYNLIKDSDTVQAKNGYTRRTKRD